MTKKAIGLYQLMTGIVGVLILFFNVFEKGFSSAIITQIFAGVILYGLLAWTGYGLLNNIKNAVKYSMVLQALQIISFTIGGTLYKFCAAAFIAVGIKNGEFTWGAALRPIDFAIASVGGNEFTIIVYLVPVILLWGLTRIK